MSFFKPVAFALTAFSFLLIPEPGLSKGLAPKPEICDRVCWGARPPQGAISQMSGLTRAIVHHTANAGDYNTTSLEDSKANVRATQNYHMDVNGWSDIGYHFLSDKLGYTFEGRDGSLTKLPRGAHDGANTDSFGFNIMGYYHSPENQEPTAASLDALYDVIAWRMPDSWNGPYGWPGTSYGTLGNEVGHIDSHRRVKATACPGDLIHNPYIGNDINTGAIRDEVQLRIDGGACNKTIPNAPSGLTAVAVGSYQIDLAWTDNSADEDTFIIARSSTAGGPYSDLASVAANITTFSDTNLLANTTYYYVVRAKNCAGSSANSNEASATTDPSLDHIIDNPQATVVGAWSTGTSAVDKYGGDYRFKGQGTGSEYLQYTPNIAETAEYNVYEWHSQGSNRTQGGPHVITHSGGTTTVNVNQQANGGKWNLLGKFTFDTGTAGHVRITDGFADSGQVVIADAIKFEFVGASEPPPPATDVHVQSITINWIAKGKNNAAEAVVNIVDASGLPVEGATVTGDFSGAISESGSAVTGADGNASIISSGKIRSGTVTFCVTNVSGTNLNYDSVANVETCDSGSI